MIRIMDAVPKQSAATWSQAHDVRACAVAQAVAAVGGVERVILFGSRARGDHRPNSDIDLLVIGDVELGGPIFEACHRVADRAVRDEYDQAIGIDIVPLTARHFDFAQHGINHIAAKVARDGVTPMGYKYRKSRSPAEPTEPGLSKQWRQESMERAFHACSDFSTLTLLCQAGPDAPAYHNPHEWDRAVGMHAQGAIEHALKAVIAPHGVEYPTHHVLSRLLEAARIHVPKLALHSELNVLTAFAGSYIYGTPELNLDVDQLLDNARQDMTDLFAICAAKADYDPWTIDVRDFKPDR